MLNTYLQGLAVGLGLIAAIGAQNIFVLRQGLKQKHVFWVCLVCALSDAALIMFGVLGFAEVLHRYPQLIQLAKWGGALFLLVYGAQHALQAWKNQSVMAMQEERDHGLCRTLLICLALTWLNPHVYLDTVILLGSLASQFAQPLYFAAGAMSASVLFFFSLGYGARALLPLFQSRQTWRVLDALIACVMWGIALSLVLKF